MAELAAGAVCQFYRLVPDAPEPRRADTSADGMLMVEAYRYCEAMRRASAFGWYIYPPINFMLILEEDEQITWTYEGADARYALTFQGAQFPGFRDYFSEVAPESIKALAPTFLTQAREPGVVQIWSGYFARTAPGWALLSRGAANIPNPQPYRSLEGIVESDEWFGPLFTNIRLTRTNSPVHFNKRYPLFQVQPVLRQCYREPPFEVCNLQDFTAADWQRFAATIVPNANPARDLGHYAVETRKRLRNAS
jgi:hypothetical protein